MADFHVAELHGFFSKLSNDLTAIEKFGYVNGAQKFYDVLSWNRVVNKIATSDIDIFRYISSHLTHISVNQSNPSNANLIKSSYVFCDQNHNGHPVNFSDTSTHEFVEFLVNLAHRERELSVTIDELHRENAINEQPVCLLYGDRGTGKTFFLNYAVTKENRFLNSHKVIWVRVNLVYRSDFEGEIERWVLAQAAKIVLRYYDVKSEYDGNKSIELRDHIFKWIDENPLFRDFEKVNLRRSFRLMIKIFSELAGDRRISKETCDDEICSEIYRYLRSEGWSFVFIIDGFDQLDVSLEQRERFELIRNDIISFISMRANFGGAFLIVSRTNTIADLNSFDPFKSISEDMRFFVGTPSWRQVIEQRFSAIDKAVLDHIPLEHNVDVSRLKSRLKEFRYAWLEGADPLEGADEALMANIRAIMQVLYLHFVDYVDERTGKGYQVIEHMMLNGHQYPVVAYRYSFSKDGSLISQVGTEVKHEARFFPLVTRAPWPTDNGRLDERPFGEILLQFRCIQILIASTKTVDQELLSKGEIIELLEKFFGYEAASIDAAINELVAFEFAKIDLTNTGSADSRENRISTLPKSAYFIEKCLFDVAYLNMCSMRTPLPESSLKSDFVIPDSLGRPGHRLERWIPNKVGNALFLFSILLCVNAVERRHSQAFDRGRLSMRQRAVLDRATRDGLWTILDEQAHKVSTDVLRILEAARGTILSEADRNGILEKIRDFMKMVLSPREDAKHSVTR